MTIKDETIKTREHFAAIYQKCIAGAKSGEFKVNDLAGYIASQEAAISSAINGDYDHTFTYLQYAHYLKTGKCIPLLP